MSESTDKRHPLVQLIESKEFDKVLEEGAELKNNVLTNKKNANKTLFDSFYEIMTESSPSITKILNMKKKERSEADKERLKLHKQKVRQMYFQAQKLLSENIEDGKKTITDKIIDKIIPLIDILRYIGDNNFENQLRKNGIIIDRPGLEIEYSGITSENKQTVISGIIKDASNIKKKADDDQAYIKDDLFQTKVPSKLQFNKGTNNAGLKPGDFTNLVNFKAKMLLAKTKDAKDKADEKIQKAATNKQFEAVRASLVRDKLLKI